MNHYSKMVFDSKGGQLELRERNQLQKVYTPNQLTNFIGTLIKKGGEVDLRTRVDLLMGHFMLLRSGNRLEAQIADLYFMPQYMNGPTRPPVNLLMLLLRKGKVVNPIL